MSDLLDVVDEHDQPTGQTTTKQEAHSNQLIHRIAAVLVFTPAGKLLIQVHKQWDRRFDHAVGGHVETGEDYFTAAKREMFEELGLQTKLEELAIIKLSLEHFDKVDPEIRHMYGVYKTIHPIGWSFVPNDEVDQLIEMELEEVVELMNKSPEKFLKGFLISLGAYLRVTKSQLNIVAYGKNWNDL